MNPTIMSILLAAKQDELLREIDGRSVLKVEGARASSVPMKKLAYRLASLIMILQLGIKRFRLLTQLFISP